jgi:hypothetical protein
VSNTCCSIKIEAVLINKASGCSTVAQHMPHHPKVVGSSPATATAAAAAAGVKTEKKYFSKKKYFIIIALREQGDAFEPSVLV